MCRICLKPDSDDDLILSRAVVESDAMQCITLMHAFNLCTQLQASCQDALPQTICLDCSEKLLIAYELVSQAAESDAKLRQVAGEDYDDEESDMEVANTRDENFTGVDTPTWDDPDDAFVNAMHEELGNSLDPRGCFEELALVGDSGMGSENDATQEDVPFDYDDSAGNVEYESVATLARETQGRKADGFMECPRPLEIQKSSSKRIFSELHEDNQPKQTEQIIPVPEPEPPKQYQLISYDCSVCGKSFSAQFKVERHFKAYHSNEKKVLCDFCPAQFRSTSDFRKHQRVHTNERPFGCPYCGKRFKVNATLKMHLVVHTGERPYACKQCNKRYTQPSALGNHIRSEHQPKAFGCPECDKRFSRKVALQQHLKVHRNIRDHVCELCDRRYFTKGALVKHLATHKEGLENEGRERRRPGRPPKCNQVV